MNDVELYGESARIPRGESRMFQVTESYATYQWYLNGIEISGATSPLYTLNTTAMRLGVHELSIIVSTNAGGKLSGYCHISVEMLSN
jgi:hypothetical protein